jgi:hypothetical protein
MAVFEADRWAWEEVTVYPSLQKGGTKPDLRNWSARRSGKLVWERRRSG